MYERQCKERELWVALFQTTMALPSQTTSMILMSLIYHRQQYNSGNADCGYAKACKLRVRTGKCFSKLTSAVVPTHMPCSVSDSVRKSETSADRSTHLSAGIRKDSCRQIAVVTSGKAAYQCLDQPKRCQCGTTTPSEVLTQRRVHLSSMNPCRRVQPYRRYSRSACVLLRQIGTSLSGIGS